MLFDKPLAPHHGKAATVLFVQEEDLFVEPDHAGQGALLLPDQAEPCGA